MIAEKRERRKFVVTENDNTHTRGSGRDIMNENSTKAEILPQAKESFQNRFKNLHCGFPFYCNKFHSISPRKHTISVSKVELHTKTTVKAG